MEASEWTRRGFVWAGAWGAGLWLSAPARAVGESLATPKAPPGRPAHEEEEEEGISANEDLMREHGVLRRLLIVYDEALRRLEAREDLPPAVLADGAGIVRRFVEDYHEKLEEEFLFPRYEKAHRLVDLVATLRIQHHAGRRLTDTISRLAPAHADASSLRELAEAVRSFIRMYRPHAAREDTVLFPALHRLVSAHEYGALGEDFEKKERELLRGESFESTLAAVEKLEKTLGLDELARFTPA